MAPEYGATCAISPIDERDPRLSPPDRPRTVPRRRWWNATPRSRVCSTSPVALLPPSQSCSRWISPAWNRASPGLLAPRTASALSGARGALSGRARSNGARHRAHVIGRATSERPMPRARRREPRGGLGRFVPGQRPSFDHGRGHRFGCARSSACRRNTPNAGRGRAWYARLAKSRQWSAASSVRIDDGHVVIAAITSCTNTSNPQVMIGAGLLAKRAVERGLRPKPWVKTSLAPGSRVVTEYLERAGLIDTARRARLRPRRLRLHHLHRQLRAACSKGSPRRSPPGNLAVCAVLSGNRNFEGRIHPEVRMNYLASPAPRGRLRAGRHHGRQTCWPSRSASGLMASRCCSTTCGPRRQRSTRWWRRCLGETSSSHPMPRSTTATSAGRPSESAAGTASLADGIDLRAAPTVPRARGRPRGPDQSTTCSAHGPFVVLGDSVTTDHISPAGAIPHRVLPGRT